LNSNQNLYPSGFSTE